MSKYQIQKLRSNISKRRDVSNHYFNADWYLFSFYLNKIKMKRRIVKNMKLIVNYPDTKEGIKTLENNLAHFQATLVISSINRLNCDYEIKKKNT